MQRNSRWSLVELAVMVGVNPAALVPMLRRAGAGHNKEVRKTLPAQKVDRLWKFNATEANAWARDGKAAETQSG